MKAQETKDAELLALSVLALQECIHMMGDNILLMRGGIGSAIWKSHTGGPYGHCSRLQEIMDARDMVEPE